MRKSVCGLSVITGFIFCLFCLPACAPVSPEGDYSSEMRAKIEEMAKKVKKYSEEEKTVAQNMETFEKFNLDIFGKQDWSRIKESHSKDIVVYWPNGHHTDGIDKYIEDLKEMFIYSPDTRIQAHQAKFGAGEYTCVTGIMTGAFTKPLPVGNGKYISPTFKKFSISICTIGHWKNGVMTEKWLYWDSASYMDQIGLGK